MEKTELFNQIKHYIKEDDLYQAIQALEQLVEEHQPGQTILPSLIYGELKVLNNKVMHGLIMLDEELKSRNNIRYRIFKSAEQIVAGQFIEIQAPLKSYDELRNNTQNQLQFEFKNKSGHFYKKYIENVYFNRKEPRLEFDKFVRQADKRCSFPLS